MNKLLLLILSISLFSACKKTTEFTSDPSYTMLKVGNYWVYASFTLNNGVELRDSDIIRDSIHIVKDTSIRGNTYFKLCRFEQNKLKEIQFLRDSANDLVNHVGLRMFSSEDFTSIFYSRKELNTSIPYDVNIKMGEKDFTTITPNGLFLTRSAMNHYKLYINKDTVPVSMGNKYSSGVGLVSYSNLLIFDLNYLIVTKKLLRYHVQ